MNRIKGIIYELIGFLARCGFRASPRQKRLLIIRIDEIGDYMLWRNFLNEWVSAPAYKGYEIHFCGNKSWESLFTQFDSGSVQQSFWIDKNRFKKKLTYRYRFLRMIFKQQYDTVINPTFSRDKRYDDSIVKAAAAPNNIGMIANLESVKKYEQGYDQGLYTKLFDDPEKPLFEFYRNRLFSSFVIGHASVIKDTRVPLSLLPGFSGLPEKFVVVFPGSRSAARIWPTEYFIQTANHLYLQYGFTIVVCGSPGDTIYTKAFCDQYTHLCLDLTGKTSLPEMLSVLQKASLLLSVDTGSVHLAAAVGCPVAGIFNGSQYKRFAPYPKELSPHFHACYPDHIEQELAKDDLISSKYEFVISEPYSNVLPEKVIRAIDQHFHHV